jgi:tripartite ATP-independent transporter DctP family solute receptor
MNKKFLAVFVVASMLFCTNALAASKEIHYGTWASSGEAAYEGMEEFKRIVEKETDGAIKVFLYPADQLGKTQEQLEQVQMGTIQMMSSGQPPLVQIEYLSLPYLVKSLDNWRIILSSEIGKEWNEESITKRGIRTLGLLPRGPRVISSNKIINEMADLKGLKIRSPERDYYVETLAAFGSQPTTMGFGEIYTSLQTGLVDGQENPIETIVAAGFHEVQKCIALTNHINKPAFVIINEEFFQGLTTEQQEIVIKAQEAAEALTQKLMEEQQESFLEKARKSGVVITSPDLAPFIESTQSVRDKLGNKTWGPENYKKIVEMGRK